MTVLKKIKLGPAVHNCPKLAETSLKIVLCEAGGAFEIRVVFGRYLEFPLKEKRGRGFEVTEYEIADNTSLKKIHSMWKFLSQINTKQKLTI